MSTFRRRQPRKEGKGNLAEMSSGHAVLQLSTFALSGVFPFSSLTHNETKGSKKEKGTPSLD